MELVELITILIGNGALIAIISFIFRYYEKKSDRDLEARRKAEGYYMPLYGHVAILDELARGYKRSLEMGKAKVFAFKDCNYEELTSKEILDDFKNAYDAFSKFYIKKKSEGYEIFVSEKLRESLSNFWVKAKSFYEDNEKLKDAKEVDTFHNLAEETTKVMEKLFGLKQFEGEDNLGKKSTKKKKITIEESLISSADLEKEKGKKEKRKSKD